MVSDKNFIIGASSILSRAVATPLPEHELSVSAAEVRDIDNWPRNSNVVFVPNIKAGSVKKQTPEERKPKTTPKLKTTPRPKTPPSKPPTPKTTKATTTKKPKTCKIKPKKPLDLERREGSLKPAKNPQDIDENKYVLSASGTVVVTNLSGCTALFFWDEDSKPSLFHIFCEDESAKTWEAIDKVGRKAVAYSIVASKKIRYDNAKKEIVDYAENEGWPVLIEIMEKFTSPMKLRRLCESLL